MDEPLAKPDKTIVDHSLEVYRLGLEIAKKLEIDGELTKRVLLACLLHDVGKATESFQKYIRGKKVKAYPHALASLPFILVAEHMLFGKPLIATAAVVSHHSPLSPWLYQGWPYPKLLDKIVNVLDAIFIKADFTNLDTRKLYSMAITLGNPSDILHGYQKSLLAEFKEAPSSDFASVKTVLHLADWLASSGINDASSLFLENGKSSVLTYIRDKGFNLREFQKSSSNLDSSADLRVRAPTGSGKTEALLLWAGDTQRIIYLLPTQATVTAMWKRLSTIFGEENVGISHGRARYFLLKNWHEKHNEDEPPLDYQFFPSVFAKPVVVATLDQYLMGYMNGKHWEERQTLSKNSAVIIDEIHSYEPFTLGILKAILDTDRPKKLAFASATLPDTLLRIFGDANLIEADETFWKRKRHKLKILNEPIDSRIQEAIRIAKAGGKVLIIANSVQKAQEIYEQIHSQWPKTTLLHARFIYRDRMKKENLAMRAEPGTILVSTQIVEVSLDISYDVLLTEIAPIDALIQRMGRVNRKGEKPPVDVYIFTDLNEASSRVYESEYVLFSAEILKELPEIPNERDFTKATNILYQTVSSSQKFKDDFEDGKQNLFELRKYLGNYTIDLADEEFRSRFITRKGMISVDVIPEKFVQEAYRLIDEGKKWRLVELTLPIHWYWTKIWPDRFVPLSDLGYIVAQMDYDSNKGLINPSQEDSSSANRMW